MSDRVQAGRWPRTLRAFRHPSFRLFWLAQLVSLSGAQMQIVALSWLAYRLTDSSITLGVIGLVSVLPVGPVSLVGGVISDRLPRRRLILTTQLVLMLQALILAALAWYGWVRVWHIMAITFVVGAADAVEQPARFAFLMDIVGQDDFGNALGLNSAVVNAARLVGPVIAGTLIGAIGEAGCFLLNGATYLIVVMFFVLMQVPVRERADRPVALKADLLNGLKYAYRNTVIRGVLLLTVASYAVSRTYVVLMPVFAQDVLHVDARGYGWLMSAIGAGSACGALISAGVSRKRYACWLVGAGAVFPAFLLLFAGSRWLWPSMALLFVASAGQFVQQVLANSMIQLEASAEYQGRIVSLFSLFSNGLTRLGGVPAGTIAELWSAPVAVAGGAVLSLVWLLVVAWRMPLAKAHPPSELNRG
jgi:MFS family permease